MIFFKGMNLDFLHENEADEELKKIFPANIFTKGTCRPNYSQFYVEGQ